MNITVMSLTIRVVIWISLQSLRQLNCIYIYLHVSFDFVIFDGAKFITGHIQEMPNSLLWSTCTFWLLNFSLQLLLCTELCQYGSLALIQKIVQFSLFYLFFPMSKCHIPSPLPNTASFTLFPVKHCKNEAQPKQICVPPMMKPNYDFRVG